MNNTTFEINEKYLYLITHRLELAELCAMEMRYIFGNTTSTNYHLSNQLLEISRSVFIRGRVDILYTGITIENIEQRMINDNLHFDNYKITYYKFDEVPYETRLKSMRTLGYTIEGDFAIHNPDVEFILTKINGIWIFGIHYSNPDEWLERLKKPFNYSNALEVKVAKAIVNIAANNNFSQSFIDPCCGIGTVLIEGRTMGINIKGYEINPLVKQHCNINLKYFGFEPDVGKINMLETTDRYNVAILDLPYGQFSLTTVQKQTALIKKTKEISDKSIIITMDDMSNLIEDIGLEIIDKCKIKKSNAFSRYITICK